MPSFPPRLAQARISRKPVTMKRHRMRFPGAWITILGVVSAGLLGGCGTQSTDYQEFSAQDVETSPAAESADAEEVTPAVANGDEPNVKESGNSDLAATVAETVAEEPTALATAEKRDQTVDSSAVATAKSDKAEERSKPGNSDAKNAAKGDVAQSAADRTASAEVVAANATETMDETSATDEAGQKEATPAGNGEKAESAAPSAASAKPRKVEILVKEREFRTEGPEGALRISYDDFDLLKVLNMEPVTPDAPNLMPDWLKNLDGKRVRVRGFMYPPFQETGIRAFVLARDNQICCFGRNPKIYDLVEVRLRDGVTTDYIQNRPFDVVGIFRIDAAGEDGELYGLYKLDDAIVIDN